MRKKKEEAQRRAAERAEQLLEMEEHQKQYLNRLREIKGDNSVYYYKQMERRARSQEEAQDAARARALEQRRQAKQLPRSVDSHRPGADDAAQGHAHDRGKQGQGQDGGKLPALPKSKTPNLLALANKTGGSQIPKQGLALKPLVPPALKKWAQEKEIVENKVRARKEYAAKLRSQFKLKRKDKEPEQNEVRDMVVAIVSDAKLRPEYVDIFLKRFKILKLSDFCRLDEVCVYVCARVRACLSACVCACVCASGDTPIQILHSKFRANSERSTAACCTFECETGGFEPRAHEASGEEASCCRPRCSRRAACRSVPLPVSLPCLYFRV